MSPRYDEEDYEDEERDREERDLGDDPGIRMLLPVGRSGWAIAAGYLGLISVLCIPAPLALIAGILAIREMRRNPKKHGMGRAVFGIVMGLLGTLGLALILVALVADAMKRR
jgi:hypothetical protein